MDIDTGDIYPSQEYQRVHENFGQRQRTSIRQNTVRNHQNPPLVQFEKRNQRDPFSQKTIQSQPKIHNRYDVCKKIIIAFLSSE